MNGICNINCLARPAKSALEHDRQNSALNDDFLNAAKRIYAAERKTISAETERANMSMEEYKLYIYDKISELSVQASSMNKYVSVQISDKGFEAMKNDSDYEEWALDTIEKDFGFENPRTGGYVIHHFGASKEEYHAESRCLDDIDGKDLIYESKAKSFWEQRAERHKKYMEIQKKAAERRRMLRKLQMSGGSVSIAELLLDLL